MAWDHARPHSKAPTARPWRMGLCGCTAPRLTSSGGPLQSRAVTVPRCWRRCGITSSHSCRCCLPSCLLHRSAHASCFSVKSLVCRQRERRRPERPGWPRRWNMHARGTQSQRALTDAPTVANRPGSLDGTGTTQTRAYHSIILDHSLEEVCGPCALVWSNALPLRGCVSGVSRWFTPLACGPGSPELSTPIRIWLVNYLHFYIAFRSVSSLHRAVLLGVGVSVSMVGTCPHAADAGAINMVAATCGSVCVSAGPGRAGV